MAHTFYGAPTPSLPPHILPASGVVELENGSPQIDLISYAYGGTTVTVTYTGTADAATMKGKVTVGELGEGTFTGKKQ